MQRSKKEFDVIVIGAGHAGLEAVFACAHAKLKVALITLNENSIALTPCNPSIGGPAKGIVTREISALGGMQAKAADACQLQMKLLNISKGAGVQALRAQIDKIAYHKWFLQQIKHESNITLIVDEVTSLIIKKNAVFGVVCSLNKNIKCKKVIITSGTYMDSLVHIGDKTKKEGPQHLPFSKNLSGYLKKLGIELIRLKTGTPPRIQKKSINYKIIQKEPGTNAKLCFDYFKQTYLPIKQQALCYLTYTNAKTHKLIRDNIHRSAMYSGKIKGVGPRYCPSIEDKVIRFHDKPRHQLFIEPESKVLDTVYIQGLSTSFPEEVQDKIVHSIKGLEKAKIVNYAYAIEYDAINPVQLWPTLETKIVKNLYFAGQVNGTSGYEEAAGQGLLAGINAICSLKKYEPVILTRDQAYIGVMIDDLVTKGVDDPYRLLTSRAEHRLLLRNDNADDRLINIGYKVGLISKKNYQWHQLQKKTIANVIKYLKDNSLHAKKELVRKFGNSVHDLYTLLKRPEVSLRDILPSAQYKKLNATTVAKIEILVKFDGYIKNQEKYIDKFNKHEEISLIKIKDYKKITNLSLEAQDKLNKIKPLTLGQAQRISGINMTDLMIIKYFIDNNNR